MLRRIVLIMSCVLACGRPAAPRAPAAPPPAVVDAEPPEEKEAELPADFLDPAQFPTDTTKLAHWLALAPDLRPFKHGIILSLDIDTNTTKVLCESESNELLDKMRSAITARTDWHPTSTEEDGQLRGVLTIMTPVPQSHVFVFNRSKHLIGVATGGSRLIEMGRDQIQPMFAAFYAALRKPIMANCP